MKNLEILINGKAYPCNPSMGAMLRFKKETGLEYTEADHSGFTTAVTMMWCCTVSSCKREGIPFDMSLMDFADSMTLEALQEWNKAISGQSVNSEEPEGEEKKSL